MSCAIELFYAVLGGWTFIFIENGLAPRFNLFRMLLGVNAASVSWRDHELSFYGTVHSGNGVRKVASLWRLFDAPFRLCIDFRGNTQYFEFGALVLRMNMKKET